MRRLLSIDRPTHPKIDIATPHLESNEVQSVHRVAEQREVFHRPYTCCVDVHIEEADGQQLLILFKAFDIDLSASSSLCKQTIVCTIPDLQQTYLQPHRVYEIAVEAVDYTDS